MQKEDEKVEICWPMPKPFLIRQILDSSKLKEFADDNFKFDENGRKLYERVENTGGGKEKLLDTSNFSFSQSVFQRLVWQTRKNQGLFGKGLITLSKLLTFSEKKSF